MLRALPQDRSCNHRCHPLPASSSTKPVITLAAFADVFEYIRVYFFSGHHASDRLFGHHFRLCSFRRPKKTAQLQRRCGQFQLL